ncbi:MAG: SGNH/GDSL hydrolase family protein [Candidatus Omnitrophica bacterium]|nr:SGNH/GDSL hydrolase family protein [Candidatus Omnitrophota bacterium]
MGGPSLRFFCFICFSAFFLGQAAPGQEDSTKKTSEVERIKILLQSEEPITWVITGDSITHGALHTHGARSYPEHFAERVRWELGRVRDVVINTGISGDTVPGLLNDLDHRVLRFKPTVVSIMMGMNDAVKGEEGRELFQEKYRELIERLKKETEALILLHTPNPITPAADRRQDLPAYSEIIREIAKEYEVALVDQERMWKDYLSKGRNDLNYLLNDGTIHPNAAGHILFAHNLFRVLDIFDPESRTCRLYTP